MQRYLLGLIILISSQLLSAQLDKYHETFIPPMDIPMYLSGNFGELRGGHFHSGIDIKTQGKTGIPVKSIEDGYLARVYVSPYGYGHALYIAHPNGYTSVYGHLSEFSPKINALIKQLQYKNEQFFLDHSFSKNELVVKQGETIALSGNTGSSGGPHLHFEIRNTQTEHPINPLHFGFDIKDQMRPQILGIKIFPITGKGSLNHGSEAKYYPTVFYKDAFHLKATPQITVYGQIGIGIETFDYLSGDWSKCGTYSAKLYVDDVLTFGWTIDSLSFDELRYINTVCDYKSRVDNYKWIVKMFRNEPNNFFSNYLNSANGILHLSDGLSHTIKIVVHDAYGNSSHLAFKLYSKNMPFSKPEHQGAHYFTWDKTNTFKDAHVSVEIPSKALYQSQYIDIKPFPTQGEYSNIYQIHHPNVALHKSFTLSLKPKEGIATDKLYISQISRSGKQISAIKSEPRKGWITATTRSFGFYVLDEDTVPPVIKSLDLSDGKAIYGRKQVRFKIEDKESGIFSYRGEIDGQWVLFEYDAKKKTLAYNFDEQRISKKSNHIIYLRVKDNVGNLSQYSGTFKW